MMKNISHFLAVSLLFADASCSKQKSKHVDKIENVAFNPTVDHHSTLPRVEIVKKIDDVILLSIREGWGKSDWVKKFGPPRRADTYQGNFEFIQYYDTGPFEDTTKKLISGITIKLRGDKTFDYSYRTTSFGLPENYK